MTELGGGVIDDGRPDPWADTGYQPHAHGPAPAAAAGMPVCPWCDEDEGHELNTGPLGGLICGGCGNQFTSAPGEYEAMAGRRALWAEETRPADHEAET